MRNVVVEVIGGVAHTDFEDVIILDLDNFEDVSLVGNVILGKNVFLKGSPYFAVTGDTDDDVLDNLHKYAVSNDLALVRVVGGVADAEYVPEDVKLEIIDFD